MGETVPIERLEEPDRTVLSHHVEAMLALASLLVPPLWATHPGDRAALSLRAALSMATSDHLMTSLQHGLATPYVTSAFASLPLLLIGMLHMGGLVVVHRGMVDRTGFPVTPPLRRHTHWFRRRPRCSRGATSLLHLAAPYFAFNSLLALPRHVGRCA